jgi:Fuc2NAc and GlcNAc transferase
MTFVILAAALASTVTGTWWYRAFAGRRGILAHKSARTLHERVVPRGAGAVFAAVFVLAVAGMWVAGSLSTLTMLGLGAGGVVASVAGLFDDVYGLRAGPKLAIHAALSLWLFAILYQPVYAPALTGAAPIVRTSLLLAAVFVPVWLINLYNFIDGIDGMAAGAAVFICVAAMTALWLKDATGDASLVLALLLAVSAGFLAFNLPAASVFMGDAGSIFLGYAFAAVILVTVGTGQLSPAVWVTILGYYIGDTTTTTVCRMVMVKRWYGVHRSHAYQNLARVLRSHAPVTYGVAAYNVLWVLPLVVWSSRSPGQAYTAAALSVAPAVLWALRFGPPYSKD